MNVFGGVSPSNYDIESTSTPTTVTGGIQGDTFHVGTNVFGDPDTVARKLDVLRRHCEREGRTYDEIERTSLTSVLLARDELALKAKRERLNAPDPFRGFAVTVPQAVDLVGRYRDVGVQLLITGIYKNDPETLELLATEVMPHFA